MQIAKIQIQDVTGAWVTVGSTIQNDQMIKRQLDTAQRTYKRTVRAIDNNGNILQLQ
jgi:uncharacterized protein (UPF0303 family)